MERQRFKIIFSNIYNDTVYGVIMKRFNVDITLQTCVTF